MVGVPIARGCIDLLPGVHRTAAWGRGPAARREGAACEDRAMGSDEGAAGARWRWEHAVVVVALGLWTLGFFAGLTETPWRAIDDDENTTIVQAELLAAGLPVRGPSRSSKISTSPAARSG